MASAKMFKLSDDLTIDAIGRGIEGYMHEKKKMKTQAVSSREGYVIKGESEESWLRLVGLGLMQQVQLIRSGDLVSVTVIESRWIEKFLAWFGCLILETILFWLFWPLMFVPATIWICITVGIIRQYLLPQQIIDYTEVFIMSGGRDVNVNLGFNTQAVRKEADKTVCPKCKSTISPNVNFCDVCGAKVKDECPHCHAAIAIGKKFCPNCGQQIEVAQPVTEQPAAVQSVKQCPNCHSEVKEGQKFCMKCGTPVE